MKDRVIELSVDNRREVIELPVNPAEVEFTEKQLNQTITLLNIGEANLKGERVEAYKAFQLLSFGEVSVLQVCETETGSVCFPAERVEKGRSGCPYYYYRYESESCHAD